MPFDVLMPDGTLIQDIPDGTTKEQIKAKWDRRNSVPEKKLPLTSERVRSEVEGLIGIGRPEDAPFTAGTVLDPNYLAGLGSKFVDIGRGINATFSSQEKSDEIARLSKEEERLRSGMTPVEKFGFQRGVAAGGGLEAFGGGKAISSGMGAINALKAPGVLGAGLRTAVGSAIGGTFGLLRSPEEGENTFDRMWPGALIAAGFGAGLEAIPYAMAPFKNMVASAFGRGQQERFGKMGGRLRERLPEGTKLTIAEETVDPDLLSMQNTALASTKGKTLSIPFQNKQAIQQKRMANAIAGQGDDVGESVASVVKSKGDALNRVRSSNAATNYGAVRNSALGSDTRAGAPKLQEVLDDIESGFPGLGKSIRQANLFVDKLSSQGGTASDFVNLEARLRQIISQKGWIAGKPDAAGGQDKYFARKLHDALVDDMDQASRSGLFAEDVSKKLRFAIDRYREDSVAIQQFGRTKLGSMFKGGKVPTHEELTDALSTMKDRDVALLARWSDEFDPSLKQKVVQNILRNAIQNSSVAKEAGQVKWDKAAFTKELIGNGGATERKINILLKGNPQAKKNLDDLKEFILRSQGIASRTYGMGESAKQELSEGLGSLGGSFSGHPGSLTIFGPKFLAKWLTGPRFAEIIFSPNGAKTIADLNRILANRGGIREIEAVMSMLSPELADSPPVEQKMKDMGIKK